MSEQLLLALAALSDRQRAVLEAHVLDGQSFAEIAADLGITKRSAQVHYERAIARLSERADLRERLRELRARWAA